MIVKDQEGTVKSLEEDTIVIGNNKLRVNGMKEHVNGIKPGDKVRYGYDDMAHTLKFIKKIFETQNNNNESLAEAVKQLNWNIGSLLLLKEYELELRTLEEYKKLSKRFK